MHTVVIIENELMLESLYKLELEEEGYTVMVAKTAQQALALAGLGSVDLIITDIDCFESESALANNLFKGCNIPVIINSGYHECMVQEYLSSRVTYVLKSSNLKRLKETIKIILGKKKHIMDEPIGLHGGCGSRWLDTNKSPAAHLTC